jgi:XisI protein
MGSLNEYRRNCKVWIQHDGAEDGIASQLVAAGIPRERIVLAFKPPETRPLTDYAAA